MRVGEVEDVDDVARREAELFVLDGVVVPQGDGHGALLGRFDVHRLRLHRIGQIVCKSYANRMQINHWLARPEDRLVMKLIWDSLVPRGRQMGWARGGGGGVAAYANRMQIHPPGCRRFRLIGVWQSLTHHRMQIVCRSVFRAQMHPTFTVNRLKVIH